MATITLVLVAWFPTTHADYPHLRAMRESSPAAMQQWLRARDELGLVVQGEV